MKKKKIQGSARHRNWSGLKGTLGQFISEESEKTLSAYEAQPNLIREHANQEHDTSRGGYAHRQLFELIQNSADAHSRTAPQGQIQIHLTEGFLYCADDGLPLNESGVEALMSAHLSPKRDTNEIGRFGLGFKSVLGVSDRIEFFSRTGSLRFCRKYASARIRKKIREHSETAEIPVLRQPEPIEPRPEFNCDDRLRIIAKWANNIVRLRLINGKGKDLSSQMRDFPSPFLLFVDHVRTLILKNDVSGQTRNLRKKHKGNHITLLESKSKSTWFYHTWMHRLSEEAKEGSTTLDNREDVPISWAVPLNNLNKPGQFWSYFPTKTTSLLAGILNAPWKTNEDRQNLLPGPYNDELIEVAARNIADVLTRLSTKKYPAQHLDVLPRRREAGDNEHADRLRSKLFRNLRDRKVVPDQDGRLQRLDDISYPPSELTPDRDLDLRPFDMWSAHSERARNWLHNNALSRNRLAAIDRLFHAKREHDDLWIDRAPRESVGNWFKALSCNGASDNQLSWSKAAIRMAAFLPEYLRSNGELGEFVIDASGRKRSPDFGQIFLPDDSPGDELLGPEWYVHPELTADNETVLALGELGVTKPSDERILKEAARRALQGDADPETEASAFNFFWRRSRRLNPQDAFDAVRSLKFDLPSRLKLRTLSGNWRNLHSVLFPGPIVADENAGDRNLTIDTVFHGEDQELLVMFGACDQPQPHRDLSSEPEFTNFRDSMRKAFCNLDKLPHNPDRNKLNFKFAKGFGPLQVLAELSDEGAMRFSKMLLDSDSVFDDWTMKHTRNLYPTMPCESFELYMLREYGRIETAHGIVPISDALGENPSNPLALHSLLKRPLAEKIRRAFDLTDPAKYPDGAPEVAGDEDPIPLCDLWPGIKRHLPAHQRMVRIVRCDQVRTLGQPATCVLHLQDVFLARSVGEDDKVELREISKALSLDLESWELDEILQHQTPEEIELHREEIRNCATDAERLLKAVGQKLLRERLPKSFLEVEERDGTELSDIDIAEAAIANWHTGTLKEFAPSLTHLDPPKGWAGSRSAVEFVKSLGFSSDWAGERVRKREPYLEVLGPFTLPLLHAYQSKIAKNIRTLLGNGGGEGPPRRGMVSLPTGSGKTRVTVQAVVEAMRDGCFAGGVLWIADRDELCEQAVEAWNQVWSCFGTDSSVLRISRLWARQPTPLPVSDQHVVVASIQTLKSKLASQKSQYEFLADFKLVIYDEAHRSIAPSSTSVMADIGLTRFQKANEPFLIGLTATPYRGHDKVETDRLVRRYSGNRLDDGAFESDDAQAVVGELQEMGVLAQADHEIIEGETFSSDYFTTEEWSKLQDWNLPWLPDQVEIRIASSVERTRRIIDAYDTYIGSDWPTLIFATSVDHAQTLAALLNRRGIKARAVSGKTERAVRRRIVEEFRAGGITAIVNYGVFSEGFDAPKTRAIIVARPVYSPNLYFQMIGRGLRGPKNGGDERCLILNVQDNIETFSMELAFSELDWLWST